MGITGTRLRYLDWLASREGKKGMKAVEEDETKGIKTFGRTIIVPVAIPGCGMSSFFFSRRKLIFLKLKHRSLSPSSIFLVSDTLSDDVKGKKNPAPRFIQNVRELLKEHDMVIADKYVVLILFLYYQSLTL